MSLDVQRDRRFHGCLQSEDAIHLLTDNLLLLLLLGLLCL